MLYLYLITIQPVTPSPFGKVEENAHEWAIVGRAQLAGQSYIKIMGVSSITVYNCNLMITMKFIFLLLVVAYMVQLHVSVGV